MVGKTVLSWTVLLACTVAGGWGTGAVQVCIGEDGHVGTKGILSSSCDAVDSTAGAAEHEHDGHLCRAFHSGDCGACVDIPLVAEYPAAKKRLPRRRSDTSSGQWATAAVLSLQGRSSMPCCTTAWILQSLPESLMHESIDTIVLLI